MKSFILSILLACSSYAAEPLLSVSIAKQFEPIPNSVLTNKYCWVTITYNGPATNYWAIRLLPSYNIVGPLVANDIYMTNYFKEFPLKPQYFYEMVWFFPTTEKSMFFDAELVDEQ